MNKISKEQATAIDQKWYFTGDPCIHGHIAKRGTANNICYQCSSIRGKAFRENNPDYHNKYNKEYYPENKERTKELSDAYYARVKENNYDLYKTRHDINHLKYREENRPKLRKREHQYREDNPGKVNAQTSQRRAKKLKASPSWADFNQIKEIYEECQIINTLTQLAGGTERFVVDHIYPLQGKEVSGLHVENNLQIITAHENAVKSNTLLENLEGDKQ